VINVTRADLSILQSIPRAELLKRVRFIVEASYASRFLLSARQFALAGGVDYLRLVSWVCRLETRLASEHRRASKNDLALTYILNGFVNMPAVSALLAGVCGDGRMYHLFHFVFVETFKIDNFYFHRLSFLSERHPPPVYHQPSVDMAIHVHTLPPAYAPHRHVEGDKDSGDRRQQGRGDHLA
jgi:hypothetical protein